MKRRLAIEIICCLFILLFIYAALMKLLDVEKFTVQLGQSPLLMAFAPIVAWAVPAVELGIAVMLVTPRLRRIGLYAAFTLMVMFTVYIGVILAFAQHVPCSCGGIISAMSWGQHLAFNIAFVLLALAAVAVMDKESDVHEVAQLSNA